jgi:two-component system phosphate regulon sensor histidine kinase PhoR
MINQDDAFLGIDKNSGFSWRVIVLSVPAGLIFLIFSLAGILSPVLALIAYVCVMFFNTVFLMPMSAEIRQIKMYIQSLANGATENELAKSMTEKETRDLTEAINSMHKFWVDKTEVLENRTLSDAAVLDTLPDPLLMINKTGVIIGSNLAARTLFFSTLNDKPYKDFITDAPFCDNLDKILAQTQRTAEVRLCLTEYKNKPKFFVKMSTLPWFAKGDVVAVCSFYDLDKALKFEQMQQDFVANASHELRTPLSIVSGFIETLQTTAKDDEKAREKFLKVMAEQTGYMASLVENLLSLSKIELTVNTPPTDKIQINPLIREAKEALSLKLKERNLSLKLQTTRLGPIVADAAQIKQVIQNLLDNAVKYALEGTTINVSTTKVAQIPPHHYYDVGKGEAVEITLSNRGIPIAPEDLERLTERFYRLQEHKNKNIKGTGLGLAIVAQIIRRHKGNMLITSENGLTTFKIYLPVVAD